MWHNSVTWTLKAQCSKLNCKLSKGQLLYWPPQNYKVIIIPYNSRLPKVLKILKSGGCLVNTAVDISSPLPLTIFSLTNLVGTTYVYFRHLGHATNHNDDFWWLSTRIINKNIINFQQECIQLLNLTNDFKLPAISFQNCQLSMFNFLSPIEFPAPPVNCQPKSFDFQQECSWQLSFV